MSSLRVPPPPRIFRALAFAASATSILIIASLYALSVPETQAQTAPSAPQTLAAAAACTAGQVDLTWTAPTTGTASKYQTRHKASSASWPSTGGWSDVTPATATSATITTATDGSTYDIEVRAVDTSASTAVNGTAAATTATASRVSCPVATQTWGGLAIGSLRTSWATPNAAGLTRTRFEYRYKVNTAGSYPTSGTGAWATVSGGANAKHVNITGLSSRNWDVQIRAVADDSGTDVYSRVETASGPRSYLNPVTNLSATTGTQPGEVVLTWTNPTSSNGNKIVGWRTSDRERYRTGVGGDLRDGAVYRGRSYLGAFSLYTTTTITVDPGTSYEFTVHNTGFVGQSGRPSARATSRTVPEPVNPDISPTSTNYGRATISWDYPQPAAIVLDGFQYQTRSQGETTWPASWTDATAPASDPNTPGTEWNAVINGTPGATVEARIRAAITITRNNAGGSSTHFSQPVMASGDLSLPAAPENLSAEPGQNLGEIDITWVTPASEPISPAAIAGYRIRFKPSDDEQYSEWTTLAPDANSHTITTTDRNPHDVQAQLIIDTDGDLMTTTNDLIYSQIAQASGEPNKAPTGPLPKPQGLTIATTDDSATLTWNEPSDDNVTGFRYRWRIASNNAWSRWTNVEVVNNNPDEPNEPQTATIRHLAFETQYIFELQSTAGDDTSESITATATTSVGIARINRINPTVRSITITANSSIRLSVNVYDRQDGLANSEADDSTHSFAGITTTYSWSELNGNGTFQNPNDKRSVLYTAPNQPGTYSISATAMPDGICRGHHEDPPNYDDCTATFILSVTRAALTVPQSDPVNPTGLIPESISDTAGNQYSVFTPADGGTFTENETIRISVNAPPGAVPDNTYIAIRANAVNPDDIINYQQTSRLILASNYARITAVDANGNPLTDYRLNEPAQVCLPMPNQFRDRLDTVAIVKLPQSDSQNIAALTSRAFTSPPDGLRICAALSVLPATLVTARFGTQPTATPNPDHSIGNIQTGGAPISPIWIIATTILFLAISTAFSRRAP